MSSSNSVNSGRTTSRNSSNGSDHGLYPIDCFAQVSTFPFSYISWIVYSVILIAKIVVLFKAEVPQKLPTDGFFGSQMMKFAIGVATIIFSLLVEAHHDFHDDPPRHDYIKSLSYGMAMEIIDSTSFLGLLIGSESHLVYTWRMENFIIALSSLNLMLPAISLYKLTLPSFGSTNTVPLDALYKILHLSFVNVPYFGVRVYLWQFLGADVSVFIIKNLYFIIGFLREVVSEIRKIQVYCNNRSKVMRQMPKIIPMGKLNEGPIGNMDKPLNTELENCRL
ncbi:unnamed protein product [Allacma fusca]|uniref:Uncharacterized protein n=1 Tax=Allacma fusca TaxID=39272 RepID=A0A8J2P362_9HEXA|nr:unnamed protein product [Allacma fusca]